MKDLCAVVLFVIEMSSRRRKEVEDDSGSEDLDSEVNSDDESVVGETKEDEPVGIDAPETTAGGGESPPPTYESVVEAKQGEVARESERKVEKRRTKKDPAVVPRSGNFFLHDDRQGENNADVAFSTGKRRDRTDRG